MLLAPTTAHAARFVYHLPPEVYRQATEYAHARYLAHFLAAGWGLLVLAAFIHFRVAPRLCRKVERITSRRALQALLYFPPFLLLINMLGLPFPIYRHHLALAYRQSIQEWPSWFADWATGQVLYLTFATLIFCLLYALLRRSPRRWWLWFWLVLEPLAGFGVFIAPLAVDPLFNSFQPLAEHHPVLAGKLHQLTVRAGEPIPANRMFEMLASRKTNDLNAYVTGLGASKRIIIYDTLLARESTDQLLSTFGHELGHYVLGHVVKSLLAATAGSLLLLYLGALLLHRIFNPQGRWGIPDAANRASLPVLLFLLSAAQFLAEPAINAYSRQIETAADRYALQVTTGIVADPGAAAAQAFQIEGELNLADPAPSPFIRWWLYSHPPVAARIRMAAQYQAPARTAVRPSSVLRPHQDCRHGSDCGIPANRAVYKRKQTGVSQEFSALPPEPQLQL